MDHGASYYDFTNAYNNLHRRCAIPNQIIKRAHRESLLDKESIKERVLDNMSGSRAQKEANIENVK